MLELLLIGSVGFQAQSSVSKPYKVDNVGTAPTYEVLSTGGPDGYGYTFIDSDEPSGPTFNWVDASGGTSYSLGDDDNVLVDLPFAFPFYGTPLTQIYIVSNGFLSSSNTADYSNDSLPSSAKNNIIAPFWDDLSPNNGGSIYTYYDSTGTGAFVIQWDNVPHYGSGGPYTFEVLLYPDGRILFQYLDLDEGLVNSSTIGIQGGDGSGGYYLQYTYNGNPVVPHDSLAILFSPPVINHDISITDVVLPNLVYTFYPSGQSPTWPQTGDVAVIITNGGQNDESGFNVILELNGNPYSATVTSIAAGNVDTIVFTGLSLDSVNNVVAYHDLSTDEVPSNDTLSTSINYKDLYKVGDTVTYADTLDAIDAIGSAGDLGASRIAVKFDSTDLFLFSGMYIKGIFFYHCMPSGSGCISGGNNAVAIYPDAGGVPDHNTPLFRKEIGDVGTTPGLIFVPIDTIRAEDTLALKIGSFPFYVAREIESLNAGYPFGVDNGPCVAGKGCWISADNISGGAWAQLIDYSLDYNWILGIVATTTPDYVGANETIIVPGDVKLVRMVKDGYLILNAPAERDMEIYIYNTAGKLVRDVKVKEGLARVPIGRLPSGAYFYITKKGKAGSFIVR